MKLVIYGRFTERTDKQVLLRLWEYLREKSVTYIVWAPYAQELLDRFPEMSEGVENHLFTTVEETKGFDFALSFGGDGTLLNTVKEVQGKLPVLGVNFGRLGFLTTLMQDKLFDALDDLSLGIFQIDKRTALTVESDPVDLFEDAHFGLNDLTIHKSQSNEMITVRTYVNGEFLNSYWGDGLIISTPTGSTAYSLSCGGPIIHPRSQCFVITPVAPHSLTIRPMIIPDSSVISFEIESRTGHAMVSLDTRTELVSEKIELAVRKSDFDIRLLRVAAGDYLKMLRDRMMWGKDSRN